MEKKKVSVKIGTDFYKTLERTDVEIEGAFREMIDNSTTSFMDHEEELRKAGQDKCIVKIEWDDEKIIVQDNAYGMNDEDFERAFGLNKKAKVYSENSRGQYGMGLKYGALALGSAYTVETVELGSGRKLRGTLDANELAETKAEEIDTEVIDVPEEDFGTKITITSLSSFKYSTYVKPRSKTFDTLIRKLAYIYCEDLRKHKLEIYIKDTKVTPREFTYQKYDNGDSVYNHISGTFYFNNKEYKYGGFLGELETANVSGAGFSLLQKGRAVEINYRPDKLFGKSNDFRYQRVYGEIKLEGKDWIVSFTKSKIKWEEGVEEAFIEELSNNSKVKEIFDHAFHFRKREKTPEIGELKGQKISGSFENLKSVTKSPLPDLNKKRRRKEESGEETKTVSDVSPFPKYEAEQFETISVEYKGKQYNIYVQTDNDIDSFYKAEQISGSKDDYKLFINTSVGFLSNSLNKNKKEHAALVKMAIALFISQLSARRVGLKMNESNILLGEFNEIIKLIK